jgi:iron(III) transport system substrate-binding protein
MNATKWDLGTYAAVCVATLSALVGSAAEVGAEERVLRVLTHREPQRIEAVMRMFEGVSGIPVDLVYEPDPSLEKLVAHQKALPFDVVLSNDVVFLERARAGGLTAPIATTDKLAAIPAHFRSEHGHWTALSLRTRAIVVARDRVADSMMNYSDLAAPRWKGKVCMRSGEHGYTLGLVAAMIAARGEAETKTWLTGVKANLARSPAGNDRDQIRAVVSGACDVAVVNDCYLHPTSNTVTAAEEATWADKVSVLLPTDPLVGTHVTIFGAAPLAGGVGGERVAELIGFMATDAQFALSTIYGEHPANTTAEAGRKLATWVVPNTTPQSRIAALHGAARALVQSVDFDAGPLH